MYTKILTFDDRKAHHDGEAVLDLEYPDDPPDEDGDEDGNGNGSGKNPDGNSDKKSKLPPTYVDYSECFSQASVDFISGLLRKKPHRRRNLSDCLAHHFVLSRAV